MEKIFFFGLGYASTQIAKELQTQGMSVAGSVRSFEKRDLLCAQGIPAVCFDDEAMVLAKLEGSTHVIVSIPTLEGKEITLLKYGELLQKIEPAYIGYLSSSVVYGDHQGAWVDEESLCRPSSSRGKDRLRAEKEWQQFVTNWKGRCDIFRLAGIYGPGRNALVHVQTGKARKIFKKGQVFGRIHQIDIARTVIKAMYHSLGEIYNVTDDEPAPPWEVIAYAEKLLGKEPRSLIPIEEATLNPMAQSFYQDNKRVSNRKIKEELGVTLYYPSYREGLNALLAGCQI